MAVRVGVVDSGFNMEQAERIADSCCFYLQDGALWQQPAKNDAINHGSRVIAAIDYHCPQAEIYSAQVFDQRGVTSALQVAAAIDWLVAQQVQVINLSLGLRQDRSRLRNSVANAVAEGVILCASSPARGEPVYPAAYPGVLRMTGDARCDIGQISALQSDYADFGGYVRGLDHQLSAAGASLGCAHVCGHIVHWLEHSCAAKRADLYQALVDKASYQGVERRLADN